MALVNVASKMQFILLIDSPCPTTALIFFLPLYSLAFSASSFHGKHWRIFLICVLVFPHSHNVFAVFLHSLALTTTADVVVCSFESSFQIDSTAAKHIC